MSKISKRKFYRTVYTVEILSEDPIPNEMDIAQVITEAVNGDYSMRAKETEREQCCGLRMAQLLSAAFSLALTALSRALHSSTVTI